MTSVVRAAEDVCAHCASLRGRGNYVKLWLLLLQQRPRAIAALLLRPLSLPSLMAPLAAFVSSAFTCEAPKKILKYE